MKKTGDSKDVIVVKKIDSSSLFSKQEIRDFVRGKTDDNVASYP